MTKDDSGSLERLVLTWNLRNVAPDGGQGPGLNQGITGFEACHFPIDAWEPCVLSIPRELNEKDIDGRYSNTNEVHNKRSKPTFKRTTLFPVYSAPYNFDISQLKLIIRHWHEISLPEDMPCIAVAVKCQGTYSDGRVGQYITVMTFWHDGVGRILSLDWFEGPIEDCITPEWYINATPPMCLDSVIAKMGSLYKNIPWENAYFSIYSIPQCMGVGLRGERNEAPYPLWNSEWRYISHEELSKDLTKVFQNIRSIFSSDIQEGETNG